MLDITAYTTIPEQLEQPVKPRTEIRRARKLMGRADPGWKTSIRLARLTVINAVSIAERTRFKRSCSERTADEVAIEVIDGINDLDQASREVLSLINAALVRRCRKQFSF
jgi:hypothetical protein